MDVKFTSIFLFSVEIIYTLQITDNKGKKLIPVNNQIDYIYGLHDNLLEMTCKSTNREHNTRQSLRWRISREGSSSIDCKKTTSLLKYRAHLRSNDDNTKLSCVSGDGHPMEYITLNLILNKSSAVPETTFCRSMSNVFCFDQYKRASIDVIVNNVTLREKGDATSGTYQYEYNSSSARLTVTCATTLDADELVICGHDIDDQSTKCKWNNECRVMSEIHNKVRNSVHVIYCYTMHAGRVVGNIAQLIMSFGLSIDKSISNDLSVLGISSKPSTIDNSLNYSDESKQEFFILLPIFIILVIIIVVLLVLVAHLYKRKTAGEHANGISATFVQNNGTMEFIVENNYYIGPGNVKTSIVGNEIEPLYREPESASYESASPVASIVPNGSSKNATYANFNEPNNIYGNTN